MTSTPPRHFALKSAEATQEQCQKALIVMLRKLYPTMGDVAHVYTDPEDNKIIVKFSPGAEIYPALREPPRQRAYGFLEGHGGMHAKYDARGVTFTSVSHLADAINQIGADRQISSAMREAAYPGIKV